MSVLVNKNTRLLVQGITGKAGSFHAQQCLEYGTNLVAGVTPGRGGQKFLDRVPIFNSVREAVEKNRRECFDGFRFRPPLRRSLLEAIDAGLPLVVCITEGIPVRDMLPVKERLLRSSTRLIGPNCPGIITPGECKIGIMPGYIHRPGKVGIVSRSGTLTYEAVWQITSRGLGQSTCIGIGGDPVNGTSHLDAVRLFNEDPQTEAIILIGEIGGAAKRKPPPTSRAHVRKPVAAFIAGATAPPGRRMGHAGAIVSGSSGSAAAKIAALRDANIAISPTPSDIAETLLSRYQG